jgi:hypothetical protein
MASITIRKTAASLDVIFLKSSAERPVLPCATLLVGLAVAITGFIGSEKRAPRVPRIPACDGRAREISKKADAADAAFMKGGG